jgi:sugar phosphate isomerase/epimerase
MSGDRVLLTVLNSMGGGTVEESFDQHLAWNLRTLDLKDALYGKTVEQLTIAEADQILEAAESRGLSINTLSSGLFYGDIEQGEVAFRETYFPKLNTLLDNARTLQPSQVRLLMATSSKREEILNSTVYLEARHPWVFDVYQEAVERIHSAGFHTVLENEVHNCLFARTEEIARFFQTLDCGDALSLTWDVQNLWQMGTFPSLDVYRDLRPYLGMIHVKGGRTDVPGGALKWRSGLEEASWPVIDIVNAVVTDGKSPVICLNSSHGESTPGYSPDYERDLTFLRSNVKQME